MIYLKSRELLFIKTGKTAGTSVEIALSCNATDEDIVTPFRNFEDEMVRADTGGHFPVNWTRDPQLEKIAAKKFKALRELAKRGELEDSEPEVFDFEQRRFGGHIRPRGIVKEMGQSFLDAVTIVSVVRHPYDQLISHAYFLSDVGDDRAELTRNINKLLARKQPTNYLHHFHDDRYITDIVIKYEQLKDDLAALGERFELDLVDRLPFTKHTHRRNRQPAAEILTDDEKARCFDLNRVMFETFDYAR